MGYKDENKGLEAPPKYKCPFCGNPLQVRKPIFLIICSKCDKLIKDL
jgi:ribosomal protein L37AE/L43A